MAGNIDNSQQICRICLTNSDKMNLLFDKSNNISQVIMSLADVQINENDGLSNVICTNCIFEAKNAYLFKQKCEESDKLLRGKQENLQIIYNSSNIKEDAPLDISDCQQITTTNNLLFNVEECELEIIKSEPKLLENSSESNLKNCSPERLEDDEFTETEDASQAPHEVLTAGSKKRGRPKKVNTLIDDPKDNAYKLQCHECDEVFDKKINLKRHIAIDHTLVGGDKNYECIECRKSYSIESHLIIHMKMHCTKIYDCDECDRKFPRLDILMEHKKRHTNDRSYLCPQCGKGFYNQIYLDRHMQTHSKEKLMHQCNVCGKIMTHSNHLMVHMRAHRDRTGPMATENSNNAKKLILCSVCGKSCSSRSNLAVHMRRHTGKMTNFCTVCGKGYPRSTDLTIHMRQHTGEKPFVCLICSRRFARSDKLAIHMRTHTGEKPYVCNVCGRSFAQSNDLASHKKRNTCCGLTYSTETNEEMFNQITTADMNCKPNISVGLNSYLNM